MPGSSHALDGRWLQVVTGTQRTFVLEQRVLNAVMFISMVVALLIGCQMAAIGAPLPLRLFAFAVAGGSGFLYTLGRRGSRGGWLAWAYVSLFAAVLVFDRIILVGYREQNSFALLIALAGLLPFILPRGHQFRYGVLVFFALTAILVGYTAFRIGEGTAPSGTTFVTLGEMIGDCLLATGLLGVGLFVRNNYLDRVAQIRHLNSVLEEKNRELETAIEEVRTLRGIIPICSYCREVRTDSGAYQDLETYVSEHTDALFSHGICPDCAEKHFGTALPENGKTGKAGTSVNDPD